MRRPQRHPASPAGRGPGAWAEAQQQVLEPIARTGEDSDDDAAGAGRLDRPLAGALDRPRTSRRASRSAPAGRRDQGRTHGPVRDRHRSHRVGRDGTGTASRRRPAFEARDDGRTPCHRHRADAVHLEAAHRAGAVAEAVEIPAALERDDPVRVDETDSSARHARTRSTRARPARARRPPPAAPRGARAPDVDHEPVLAEDSLEFGEGAGEGTAPVCAGHGEDRPRRQHELERLGGGEPPLPAELADMRGEDPLGESTMSSISWSGV